MDPLADRGDSVSVDDVLDGAALLVTAALVILVGAGVRDAIRTAGSVLFVLFVPGWAVVTNWADIRARSRIATSVVFSLAIVTLLATIVVWAHIWHPIGEIEIAGAVCVFAILVGFLRRMGRLPNDLPSDSSLRSRELDPGSGRKAAGDRRFVPVDLLLPASVAAWAIAVAHTHAVHLSQFGLPASLPALFYIGIAVLVLSIGITLSRRRLSTIRMAAHIGVLIAILFGTAPLLYASPRYSWQYKYIGVVQYIALHGRVDQHIDIFQNWPGFFALTAWFDKVAGIQSPIAYAKWSQPTFEALTCLVLAFAFRALRMSAHHRWLALVLYVGSVWIAQDYLAPQALGVVLSAGIFGLVLHWLPEHPASRRAGRLLSRIERFRNAVPAKPEQSDVVTDRPPALTSSSVVQAPTFDALDDSGEHKEMATHRQRDELSTPSRADTTQFSGHRQLSTRDLKVVIAIAFIYFALVVVHELTPYVVLVQVGVLAVFKRVRPKWLVVLLGAIAVAYLIPRFSLVNTRYGLLSSFGQFFGNLRPPSVAEAAINDAGLRVAADAARLLSAGMWTLGLVGAWRRWRFREPTLTLLVLAAAPVFVLFAESYGSEGILRVDLFSLPWTACLAAAALRREAGWHRAPHAVHARSVTEVGRSGWEKLRNASATTLGVAIVVALFIPAFFGNDSINVMPTQQVDAVLSFYRTAHPGVVFVPDTNFPSSLTAHYNEFRTQQLFGTGDPLGTQRVTAGDGRKITAAIEANNTSRTQPSYVLITDTMTTYAAAYGFPRTSDIEVLTAALAHAPGWITLYRRADVTIYELPPS